MGNFTTVRITSNSAKIRTGAGDKYSELLGADVRRWILSIIHRIIKTDTIT